MPNILVTGGAGYIGSHTSRSLLFRGYKPIILDNLVYGHEYIREKLKNVILIKGDIGDKNLLQKIFKDFSIKAIIHFAAYAYVGESTKDPMKYYKNNVLSSINLINEIIDFSNKNKKLPLPIVFSSSCATYGIPKLLPMDENTPQIPINAYGNTKLIIEKVLKDYGLAYGLSSISFRYFNAAGASSDGLLGENHNPETHLIPLALRATDQNSKPLIVYGNDYPTKDGTCIRDYIHVEDLANAHIIGLEKLLNSKENITETYNLAMGKGFSVMDIIKSVEKVTNKKVRYIFGKRRVGDPDKLIADPTKAYKDLSWKPEYTEIDTIIKHAWNWHKKLNNQKLS